MGCGDNVAVLDVSQIILDNTESFWNKASEALSNVDSITTDLESFAEGWPVEEVQPYSGPGITSFGGFGNPPDFPDIRYEEPSEPSPPSYSGIGGISLRSAPELDAVKPDLYYPDTPDDLSATAPDNEPSLSDIVLPDPISITLPTLGDLKDVTIPTLTPLVSYEFNETLPIENINRVKEEFSFAEDDYSSDLLTATTAEIYRMLQGGTGLPDHIWQSIVDRGMTREEELSAKAISEATSEWASNGWDGLGGLLDKRIKEARQSAQDAEQRLVRDIFIQQAQMEVENLKFAVTQGIALESVLINYYSQRNERALKAAMATVEVAINLMNAEIALYNAQLQGYSIAANVHKTLIEAEMQKIEQYKAQIDAQRLLNEINSQTVSIYLARLEAVTKEIDVYLGQLEAVKSQVEIDKNRIEIFKTQVETFQTQVSAWATEWDGYKSAVDAQAGKINLYSAEIDAFQADVLAYKTESEAQAVQINSDIERDKLTLEKFLGDIQVYSAKVQNAIAVVQAQAAAYSASLAIYEAQGRVHSSELQADTAVQELAIADARAQAENSLAIAQLASADIQAQTTLGAEVYKTIATVNAQLAAAAMAAINISTSISSSNINSAGENHNYNNDCG